MAVKIYKQGRRNAPTVPAVLYVQYTNPAAYPSLEHSSRLLASLGWKVMFLGTGALAADALCFPLRDRITVRRMPFCPAGWLQKLHYLYFCLWVLCWTIRWRPHWVYASDPLACPIAYGISFLPGIQVIYHEHDTPILAGLPTAHISQGASAISWYERLILHARHGLAARAALCILPNEQRIAQFLQEVGNPVKAVCVWNCPAQEEIALPRPPSTGDELWVLYHGSIVPSRLPETILRALTSLPDTVKLWVIGYETVGYRGYVQQLQEMASRLGLGGRVEFLGAVPTRADLFAWGRKCDVGLAFMPQNSRDVNERNMTGASNKPFDYLACGLALLVSDLPDWRRMYVEPGFGLVCDPDDPTSIAAALRWFLDHPGEMRKMGEQGRQRIVEEWNYEMQFAPVLRLLNVRIS